MDEFEASSDNEQIGDMPLAVSLNALLQFTHNLIKPSSNLQLYCYFTLILNRSYQPNKSLYNNCFFKFVVELCIVRDESIVLSPRKVMLAMADYMPNFNLTNQQVQPS